jgi:hypothetical protein
VVGGRVHGVVIRFYPDAVGVLSVAHIYLNDLPGSVVNSLLSVAGLQAFRHQQIAGELSDGSSFKTTIGTANAFFPTGPSSGTVSCILNSTEVTAVGPDQVAVRWLFKMANVRLLVGDEKTNLPLPPGRDPKTTIPGFTLNKIRFNIAGREWTLTDQLMDARAQKNSDIDVSEPVVSGLLETTVIPGEEPAAVISVARDIEVLLSLAMSRGVRVVSISKVNRAGVALSETMRAGWVPPFNRVGFTPLENDRPQSLKLFLETVYPTFSGLRAWNSQTLEMFLQAQVNDFVEIKAAILNIVLDRLWKKVVGKNIPDEIDPGLPKKLDEPAFQESLHTVFAQLSDAWSLDRTGKVCGMIKQWNSTPDMAVGIQRACGKLGLPEPDAKFLKNRNRLIHSGELNQKDGSVVEYLQELDWLVLSMILRWLGYDGWVFHPKWGQLVMLKDKLVSNPSVAADGSSESVQGESPESTA